MRRSMRGAPGRRRIKGQVVHHPMYAETEAQEDNHTQEIADPEIQ